MKHKILRTLLMLTALACPALAAQTQEEVTRHARWAERPGPFRNEELRRELLEMYKEDQAVRAPFGEGRPLNEAEVRAMRERDEADTKRLSEIFDKHGLPGVKLLGIRA